MHKNKEAAGVSAAASGAAATRGAEATTALGGTRSYLSDYYNSLNKLDAGNQSMDPGLRTDLESIGAAQSSEGNAATAEDVGNLARRTGENAGAYAPLIAEDNRKGRRDVSTWMAKARTQDYKDRAGYSMDIAKLRSLGPDVLSRIYGSASGAQSADLGHAATASGNIYQKSPWMDLLQSAVGGAATVAGQKVAHG